MEKLTNGSYGEHVSVHYSTGRVGKSDAGIKHQSRAPRPFESF